MKAFLIVLFTIALCVLPGQVQSYQTTGAANCNIPAPVVTPELGLSDEALLDYLNQGGNPVELESRLIDLGYLTRRSDLEEAALLPSYARNRGGVYFDDIDQNGYLDVIVVLGFMNEGGGIRILGCLGDHYAKIAEFSEQDLCPSDLFYDGYCNADLFAPKIIFIGDMNQDGFPEIVYESGFGGATTVWMNIRVASWSPASQTMIQLNRDTIEYPGGVCWSPKQEQHTLDEGSSEVRDTNDDQLLELIVQVGCSGSGIAAGPQRSQQLTFGWNDKEFVETDYHPDPPRYRLHAAYDALYALNHADANLALSLYDAVLTDGELASWEDNISWIVTSHALYGKLLSTIAVYGPTSVEAEQAFEYVVQTAADLDLSDTLWVDMAALLWEEISVSENLSSACMAVNDALSAVLSETPPYLYALNGIGYWPQFGYNVNWVPTDRGLSMCPF